MGFNPLILFLLGLGSIGIMALASTLYVLVSVKIFRKYSINLLAAGGVGQLAALLLVIGLSPLLGIPLQVFFSVRLDLAFTIWTLGSIGLALIVLMASTRIIGEEYLMKFPVETIRSINPVLLALILFLLAPILEEIVFRGFFFYAFKLLFNNGLIALVLSAILFMLAHLKSVKKEGLLVILAVALVLGLPVLILDTIIPSIITHIVINVIGVLESRRLEEARVEEIRGENETLIEPGNIWAY